MAHQIQQTLISFGFSEKEVAVYLALLTGGSMNADSLAKVAGLNRSTTYVQLQELINIGLVSSFRRGKKTFFAAESPKTLERVLQNRQKQLELQQSKLETVIPELLSLFGSRSETRPTVRVFEGKEGLATMRYDMISQGIKEIKIIFNIDRMRALYTRDELMQFTKLREKKKIHSSIIYSLEVPEEVHPFPFQDLIALHPKQLPFSSDVYIYGQSVSFASTEGQVVGVTINDPGVAKTMDVIFHSLWEQFKAFEIKDLKQTTKKRTK